MELIKILFVAFLGIITVLALIPLLTKALDTSCKKELEKAQRKRDGINEEFEKRVREYLLVNYGSESFLTLLREDEDYEELILELLEKDSYRKDILKYILTTALKLPFHSDKEDIINEINKRL